MGTNEALHQTQPQPSTATISSATHHDDSSHTNCAATLSSKQLTLCDDTTTGLAVTGRGRISSTARWPQRDERHCECTRSFGCPAIWVIHASDLMHQVALPTIAQALAGLDCPPPLVARAGALHPFSIRSKQKHHRSSPTKSEMPTSRSSWPILTCHLEALLSETEKLLESWKHPDPYVHPTAPGGMLTLAIPSSSQR